MCVSVISTSNIMNTIANVVIFIFDQVNESYGVSPGMITKKYNATRNRLRTLRRNVRRSLVFKKRRRQLKAERNMKEAGNAVCEGTLTIFVKVLHYIVSC